MRTKPLLGRRAWFGPRLLGWGLGPTTWQGWLATSAAAAAAGVLARQDRGRQAKAVGLGLGALAVLKGTSPGGPRRRRQLKAASVS